MNDKARAREEVWEVLRRVARPDSRFHFDFGEFIPDFEGSERALAKLLALPLYQSSRFIFITPDNCLEELRAQALRDGKTILVPTYGIRRGFVTLDPGDVPKGSEQYASWLDGMERFGRYVSLADIQHLGQIDFLITGGSVINPQGVRFGKGHGYFDLEWAMMYELGVANADTPVIAFVHDCQVADVQLEPSPFDTVCDLIVTPSRTIEIDGANKPTSGILWDRLAPGMMEDIPPLQELRQLSAHRACANTKGGADGRYAASPSAVKAEAGSSKGGREFRRATKNAGVDGEVDTSSKAPGRKSTYTGGECEKESWSPDRLALSGHASWAGAQSR